MGMRSAVLEGGREYKLSGLIGQALLDVCARAPERFPGVDVRYYPEYGQYLFEGGVASLRKDEEDAVKSWFFQIAHLIDQLPKLMADGGIRQQDLLEREKAYSFMSELCEWLKTAKEYRQDLVFS